MLSKAKLKYVKSLEQKKFRQQEGMFVAEGPKVVGDLMAVNAPRLVFATPRWIESNNDILQSLPQTELITITDDELRHLSFLQHPQQVLAVFPIPNTADKTSNNVPSINGKAIEGLDKSLAGKIILALDSVQDPGNLGTIIRIADWFGITDIICSNETADIWNPKVVQATMGSIARVNVSYTNLCHYLDTLPEGTPIYGTMLDGDDIHNASLTTPSVIVMGNEGKGISSEVAQRLTHRILIPNYPQGRSTADSLNVAIATAITCFAFRSK